MTALAAFLQNFNAKVNVHVEQGLAHERLHTFRALDKFCDVGSLLPARDAIESCKDLITQHCGDAAKDVLQSAMSFVSQLFNRSTGLSKNYALAIEHQRVPRRRNGKNTISCWLLEAKEPMEEVTRLARTVVHMSGSLADTDWFCGRVAVGSNALVVDTARVVDRSANLTVHLVKDKAVSGLYNDRTDNQGNLLDRYAGDLREFEVATQSIALVS